MPVTGFIHPAVFALIGLLSLACLAAAFYFFRRLRLIQDLPTSKIRGAFIGLTELSGTAESEQPLMSHLAGISCACYKYTVREQWRRTVTETYTDAQGRSRTRTRTESGWSTVAGGTEKSPFFLKDDTGVIRIVPEGAEICAESVFNRTCRRKDPLYYAKGPASAVANSTHRRRFTEEAIRLHAVLFVVGQARQRDDVVAAEIARDPGSPIFLISTRDEKHHVSRFGRWYWFWLLSGFVVAVAGAAVYHSAGQAHGEMVFSILTTAGLYLLMAAVTWAWTIFNSLVRLRQRVRRAWSQIEVDLKRRHDLIQNAVMLIEAYRKHESGLQILLAGLRSQAGLDELDLGNLKSTRSLLKVTLEQYPELKAGQQFLNLQALLVETEQRLALVRDYYNQIATFYNTRLESVPDCFMASITGFKPFKLLVCFELERAEVRVNLAD